MDATAKPSTRWCKKLLELPPVVADCQQTAWCPDCDYYHCGLCGSPGGREGNAGCPFDGKVLPLREVAVEAPDNPPRMSLDGGSSEVPESRPRSRALEQAIEDRILQRTGGRMRALVIVVTDRELTVRGSVPCYHVKQLALHGILDVLHSQLPTRIECNYQIVVRPPGPTEPTAPVEKAK
jgi:hypothetical protein